MARKEKDEGGGGGGGGWIVTFSDLMTLLLTFFVLLLSMSSMDERKSRAVIESVASKFSIDDMLLPVTPELQPGSQEHGAMDRRPKDLSPLREMVLEDENHDMNFLEKGYVQIFSIKDEALFDSGGVELNAAGIKLLEGILPVISQLDYPLLIAGHASPRRDGAAATWEPGHEDEADTTWLLSSLRALAVYRHFISKGIGQKRLLLEAFGQFRPHYSQNTAEGRSKNRRVDLVLDRRNRKWVEKAGPNRQQEIKDSNSYPLRLPGTPPEGVRIPSGWERR